jgi:hypothetical protein
MNDPIEKSDKKPVKKSKMKSTTLSNDDLLAPLDSCHYIASEKGHVPLWMNHPSSFLWRQWRDIGHTGHSSTTQCLIQCFKFIENQDEAFIEGEIKAKCRV